MRRILVIAVAAATLLACNASADPLRISDAEEAGFEKDQQQIFQMVQARDGWSGDWAGDRVELYEFESKEKVQRDTFKPMVQEDNVSGWVELCQARNLLMLSKGENACEELHTLAQ